MTALREHPIPVEVSFRMAAAANRHRSGTSPELPADVAGHLRALYAAEPVSGSRGEAAAQARAATSAYLMLLYVSGWPAGALMPVLGIRSRENLHRRVRRAKLRPIPSAVIGLPVPIRVLPSQVPKPSRAGIAVLPPEVQQHLRALKTVQRTQGQRRHAQETARLDHYLARLHAAGWAYSSLAHGLGLGVSATGWIHVRIKRAQGTPVPPEIQYLPAPAWTPETPRLRRTPGATL